MSIIVHVLGVGLRWALCLKSSGFLSILLFTYFLSEGWQLLSTLACRIANSLILKCRGDDNIEDMALGPMDRVKKNAGAKEGLIAH